MIAFLDLKLIIKLFSSLNNNGLSTKVMNIFKFWLYFVFEKKQCCEKLWIYILYLLLTSLIKDSTNHKCPTSTILFINFKPAAWDKVTFLIDYPNSTQNYIIWIFGCTSQLNFYCCQFCHKRVMRNFFFYRKI